MKNYDLPTAIMYLILTTLLYIYSFSFYPLAISAIIILASSLLTYFRRYRICITVIVFTLIPAIVYTFKSVVIGACLLSLILVLFIKWCNIYDFLTIMLCLALLFTDAYFLVIPTLLVFAALTPKGYGSNTLKVAILFMITYFIILSSSSVVLDKKITLFSSLNAVSSPPLTSLASDELVQAFSNISIGLSSFVKYFVIDLGSVATIFLTLLLMVCTYMTYSIKNYINTLRLFKYLSIPISTFLNYLLFIMPLLLLNDIVNFSEIVNLKVLTSSSLLYSLIFLSIISQPLSTITLRTFQLQTPLSVGTEISMLIQDREYVKKLSQYWYQIIDLESIKREIEDTVITPIIKSENARKYGVEIPKGILFFGPPGCGKTMLAKGLAGRLGWSLIIVNLGELLSKYYGESERRLTNIFKLARKYSPCVIIIDEIDAIGKARTRYVSDDITPRLLNLLLSEMDGLNVDDSKVLVIATTNQPDLLDPALLRPGRFDKIYYIPPPDLEARKMMFMKLLEKKPKVKSINFDELAKMTERYSYADLVEIVKRASLKALKEDRPISQEDLEWAIKTQRPSISINMLEMYEKFKLAYCRFKAKDEAKISINIPETTWNDIGDLDEVKNELIKCIEMLRSKSKIIEKICLRPIKGILLFGPPGCGKTMLVKALANSFKIPVIELNCADLAKYGPERAALIVKEVFNLAKDNAPCIIFIDEIDSIAMSRESPLGMVWSGVISQLLIEMDGLKSSNEIFIIAATNRPWAVDPALLRPGRFDKLIYIPLPNCEARVKILEVYLRGVKYDSRLIEKIAKLTEGYSGADLAALVREAKMEMISRLGDNINTDELVITYEDFERALKKVKPSVPKELLRTYEGFIKERYY